MQYIASNYAFRFAAAVAVVVLSPFPLAGWATGQAVAQTIAGASVTAEKQAFDSAKELGTADAWQAFLKSYPGGFHADLARAYLKNLGVSNNATTPPAPASSPSPVAAIAPVEYPCSEAPKLKSQNSDTPTKITFVNASDGRRVIVWMTFDGKLKEYAELDPGQELTQSTFLTHPWMVTNAPGDCMQIFMPVDSDSVARLEITNDQQRDAQGSPPKKAKKAKVVKQDEDDHGPTPEQSCRNVGQVYVDGVCVSKKKKRAEKSAEASCIELDMAYRNGKCVAKYQKDIQQLKKQKKIGCPAGTYLNPLGVCQPDETGG